MSKPQNTNGGMCPLFRKACAKVCHTCELWDHIRGKHPQTGQDLDHWACAFKMHTMLSIESTMAQRQTTASIDMMRKEVHDNKDTAIVGTISHLNRQFEDMKQQQLPAFSAPKLIEN